MTGGGDVMKWFRFILFLFLGLIVSTPSGFCQNKPQDFWSRGIRFNASEAETLKVLPGLKCENGYDKTRVCFDNNLKIGNSSNIFAQYIFNKDKLGVVMLTPGVSDYNMIKKLFIEKYGEPTTKLVSVKIRKKDGVQYLDEELMWNKKDLNIMYSKYHSLVPYNANAPCTVSSLSIVGK